MGFLFEASWQPHKGRTVPEVMEDCSTNVGSGENREGNPSVVPVRPRGLDQPEDANLKQVVSVQTGAQGKLDRKRPGQVQMVLNLAIALFEKGVVHAER